MNVLNPEMVTLARESRSMTQVDLAEKLGVPQGKVSRMEMSAGSITAEMLTKLSEVLHYPESFFYRSEPRLGMAPSELDHYRKRKSVGKKALESLHAQISVRRMHIRTLLANVEMETHQTFPRMDAAEFGGDGARIAQALRAMWHVPRGPIRSVTKLIEDAGGIVVLFAFGRDTIDAVSRQVPDLPPLFFMNPKVGGARYRYTLAHELGHMVMHTVPTGDMEAQADRFAAEFLMPADDIRSMLTNLTLPKIASLTPYWRVAMSSLLKRAGDLGKLSARADKSLWIQMSTAGYKTQEPPELNFPIEEPTLLRSIVEAHLNELGYSIEHLASDLDLFEDELTSLYQIARGLRVVSNNHSVQSIA